MNPARALIIVWLAVLFAGCVPVSSQQGRQPPGTGSVVDPLPVEVTSGDQEKTASMDAVFVHKGALFGIDLSTSTVNELVPVDGSGQKTESAVFARDGKRLLLHRNWVGRDSWWTVKTDGSDLRQLPILGEKQTGPVTSLRDEEFVACFKGEDLVLFGLSGGEPVYQALESDAQCNQNGQLVASPDGGAFAFTSSDSVIIARVQDNHIKLEHRVPGQKIFGWVSGMSLVTADTSNLYLVNASSGQVKRGEIHSIIPSAASLTGVAINPTGKSMYITATLKSGEGATQAVDPLTLIPLAAGADRQPADAFGPTAFSPRGKFAVWVIPGTRGVPVAIARTDTGEAFLKTNETTVPVPYSFHPGDAAVLYSRPAADAGEYELHLKDLSDKDRVLWRWKSTDGMDSVEWNPTLAGSGS